MSRRERRANPFRHATRVHFGYRRTMARNSVADDSVMKALAQGPERSPLFWWMYDRHSILERTWAGKRINWAHFCRQVAAAGITDQTGKPPARITAAKTWERVRQLKAREQAARDKRQRARLREPERGLDADRPPPVVTVPTPRPPVPYCPPPSSSTGSTENAVHSRPHEALSKEQRLAEAKAEVLRLRRVFAVRSGHDPDKIK